MVNINEYIYNMPGILLTIKITGWPHKICYAKFAFLQNTTYLAFKENY